MAKQKEKAKSQSIMSLDMGIAIQKLLKMLERALRKLISGKIVTLDISRTGIRVMEMHGETVRNWADLSFGPEEAAKLSEDGESALGTKVKQLMKSSGIKAKNVNVCISGLYTVSRLIPIVNLPPAPTLEESVNEIAQELMPVSTEALYFYWQLMGRTDGDQNVFIIGIPRNIMDYNIRALKRAGINPQIIEVRTMALARVVNKEQALILNIEPENLDIIMAVKGLPEIMFSQAWHGGSMSSEDATEYLATNLEITVEFYNNHHADEQFDMANPLYVTGQMSIDSELMERLQARLGFDVQELKPPLECPAFLPVSQYAGNIGLAMRGRVSPTNGNNGGGFYPLDVNLLPPSYLPWRPTARQVFYSGILLSAIALVFPMTEIVGEEMTKTTSLELRNETLENQLQLKMMEIQRRAPLQKAISEYQTIISREVSFSGDIGVIIAEAEKLGIEVNAISHRGTDISFNCVAEDYLSFRTYLETLAESGRFTTPIPPPEGYPYTKSGVISLKTRSEK